MPKITIKEIEKIKDRDDLSLYQATLSNGDTIDVEADTKKEAEEKVTKAIEDSPFYNGK